MTVVGELQQLRELYTKAQASGQACALATLVAVQGSSYRFPGARMLVVQDGRWAGTVSGGCLEADVLSNGLKVIASGETVCLLYDTTDDADIVLGLGMGCRGKIHVLVERLPPEGGPLRFLSDCVSRRQPAVLGTVFATGGRGGLPLGYHHYVDQPRTCAEPGLEQEAALTFAQQHSRISCSGSQGEMILWEYIKPAPSLLICGAGHDALPLVQVAQTLAWHVELLDARPAYLNQERFATVAALHLWTDPASLPAVAPTAALVMTHHFTRDCQLLPWLLAGTTSYVGLLGPKARALQVLDAVKAAGHELSPEQLQRLYAPVGLDIGAESPVEIALAIVAEIQAVLTGYSGGFLRGRSGPIHLGRLLLKPAAGPDHAALPKV